MMNSAARDVDHTLGVLQELLYHLDGAPKAKTNDFFEIHCTWTTLHLVQIGNT